MLKLIDRWIWDHWLVDTGSAYHLFYLQAPRSLVDPELRHAHATTGHAVSTNLVDWTVIGDALLPGPPGAWDDRATWTGSIVRKDDTWYCFYTGSQQSEHGLVQRIGLATSPDLTAWTRVGDRPLFEADARWYERLDPTLWHDEAWRDPWVFADPDGKGWHALVTARARDGGSPDARGVVGHACSSDLLTWEVRPPLSEPGEFGHLEVTQVACVDGQWVLVFCTGSEQVSRARRSRLGDVPAGTYVCPADGPLGPFHIADARLVTELYAARLVQRRDGTWMILGFVNVDERGEFVGAMGDPVPVADLPDFPRAWR